MISWRSLRSTICYSVTTNHHKTFHRYSHSSVRVRFAPSPTGFMHIGGLRTALINKLFAAQQSGKFILRIEDTDQLRCNSDSLHDIIDSLNWCDLTPDEGPMHGGEYGPYIQSERKSLYNSIANQLLQSGAAYRCFCSPERLQILKKEQARQKQPSKYDNRCRDLSSSTIQEKMSAGSPYTIRFKNDNTQIHVDDLVFGNLVFDSDENEGDFIIMKSDGMPVYHLANVVDDHFMQISHVIRGAEWLSSTPKHLLLYRTLGWSPPKFAHLPLILAESGGKLSKRSPEFAQIGQVRTLRAQGYLPSAVLSWLTSISGVIFAETNKENNDMESHKGWHPGLQFSDLVNQLDLASTSHQNARLSTDTLKLCGQTHFDRLAADSYRYCDQHLSQHLPMTGYTTPRFLEDVRKFLQLNIPDLQQESNNVIENDLHLSKLLFKLAGRIRCLSDLVDPSSGFLYLWQRPDPQLYLDRTKPLLSSAIDVDVCAKFTRSFLDHLNNVPHDPTPSNEILDSCLNMTCQSVGLKRHIGMRLIRLSLIGCEVGVPVVEIIQLLNVDESIKRIHNFYQSLSVIKQTKSQSC